jgi:hypothetical protein
MKSKSIESDSTTPAASPKERFGATQGRHLLDLQTRALRGLSTRWKKLSESFAVDSVVLSQKISDFQSQFRLQSSELIDQHKKQLHELQTQWDEQIDEALGRSELGTLEKTRWENQTLKTLKTKRKDAEAKQESDYSQAKSRLHSELEKSRALARQNLDQTLAKLDVQKSSIDELSTEIREWVALKTGTTLSSNSNGTNTIPPRSLAHIESLSAMAKEFEALKASYIEKKKTLQSNKAATIVSIPLLFFIALLSGGVAFAVASMLKATPLILAIASLLAAILVPILLYIAALPLVARSIRSSVSGLLEEEQSLGQLLDRGRAIAEATLKREYSKFDSQYQQSLALAQQKHQELLAQINTDYQTKKTTAIDSTVRDKANFRQKRMDAFESLNQQFPEQIRALKGDQDKATANFQQRSKATLDSLNAAFRSSQQYLAKRWIDGIEFLKSLGSNTDKSIQRRFPNWNDSAFSTEDWSRDEASLALPLGHFQPNQTISPDHPAKNRSVEFEMLRQLAGKLESVGDLPLVYDLIGKGGLILRTEDPESREHAHLVMRNLLLRAITALPAGMLQVTVIDPEGLGKKYSWLMHLADIDPELVNHRVWTQPIHIANQLALTTRHIEDVIQQSLRNQFRNLYEYNQKAGPMAIPYRMIVWSGFPFGLDDASWQSLCSILSSGSRCGVGVLIDWPSSIQWPTFADTSKLTEFALLANVHKSDANEYKLQIEIPELKAFPARMESPPDEATVASIMQKHLVAAANIGKRIVPFETIASQAETIHRRSSADGLEIPIGISDSGRIQSLVLGEGTSQHVLIAGKTGSGKSSLLHTMISSAALEYSPEELRLVLLDFKKGVEFQVYSELQLSHADIIGIESRREFGLSTLEYLDRILSARGEAFRQWGVQDLPSLKRKHPDVRLPRILIVIDEFQELFVEDDKLSQQASMLMDRIVRQGRSFGMHLVLASQTLGGAYSLPRTTLAQMAVRIALQCDSSDAMLILSEDNTAAERLRHSGQGIYNTAGGRLEANQNFQVAYLPKDEQLQRLGALPWVPVPFSPTTNSIGRRVVFEGHKMATWDSKILQSNLTNIAKPSMSVWTLGDSVSIEPSVVRTLQSAPGRNAMIVSSHDDLVASLVASWIQTSRLTGAADSFWLLDGSRSEDVQIQRLIHQVKQDDDCKIFGSRQVEEALGSLDELLTQRLAEPHAPHPTLVLLILNLAKFRELRREEDYSFSSSDGPAKPDAVLAKLLSDGPGVGIHICLWSDSVSTLTRWLSRGSIRDIELRVLGQMSANDSNQLIDNNQANRLDRNVMLVHDDADGKATKFRPFSLDSILGS